MLREIVVTARDPDGALTAKVSAAIGQDPYIFSDHVTVRTENGVVRVGGIVSDLADLYAILKAAQKVAGKGRVVDEIEYVPIGVDGN